MRIILGLYLAATMAGLIVLRLHGDPAAGASALPGVCMGCSLVGADLHGAALRGVRWTGADLSRANLQHADLRSALLEGADLRDADLRGADLRGGRFEGADFRGARLDNARFDGAHFEGADFSGQNLLELATSSLKMLMSGCAGCDFRDTDLHGASLNQIALEGDDFRRADLRGANLSGSQLASEDFRDTDLRNANMSGAILCSREITITGPVRLLGRRVCADLSGATLLGADLRGALGCDPVVDSDRSDRYTNCRKLDSATLITYGRANLTGSQGP